MKFTKLSFKNLFSYGNNLTEIPLDREGLTLIKGVNKDNSSSNGSGKSSIIDIFCWVLYGKPLKNIPIDSIKNNHSQNEGYGAVEFWKSGDFYTIDRYRGSREYGNGVVVKRNNVELENATPRDAQKRIDALIGLDYQSFVSSLIFSSEIDFEFPRITADKRREYLEQIMGLGAYSDYGKEARSRVRKIRRGLEDIEITLKERKGFLKSQQGDFESLVKKHHRFDDERNESIQTINEKLALLTTELSSIKSHGNKEEIEAEIATLTAEGDDLHAEFQRLSRVVDKTHMAESNYNSLLDGIELNYQRMVANLEKDTKREIEELKKKIKLVEHECPTCNRGWEGYDVKAICSSLEEKIAALQTHKEERIAHNKEQREIAKTPVLYSIQQTQQERESTEKEIASIRSFLATTSKQIADAKKRLSSIPDSSKLETEKLLLEQKLQQVTDSSSPYGELMESASVRIKELIDEVENLKNEKGVQEEALKYASFWDDSFNNDGLKLFIFEAIVPVLNSRIAHYIPLLFDGKEISVDFDKFMNMTIIKEGKGLPYGGLSKGERKRFDLAVALSLLETAQAQHGITANLMFFDEIIDSSLDKTAVNTVLNILYSLPIETIFLITHRNEIEEFSTNSIMTVVKDGKFSKVIES